MRGKRGRRRENANREGQKERRWLKRGRREKASKRRKKERASG